VVVVVVVVVMVVVDEEEEEEEEHKEEGEGGMGMREEGSEGRGTERMMGIDVTIGALRTECRRAWRAKETEIAGARVMEPQGEEGRVMKKEAEAEERGAMEERGRETWGWC
jgi:hypothetical protein